MSAPDEDRGSASPGPSVLGETRGYTAGAAAAAAGVPLPRARRFWRALGYPPAGDATADFTDADVAVLRMMTGHVADGTLDEPEALRFARMLSRSIANVAQTQASIVANISERSTAELSRADDLSQWLPEMEWLLGQILRRQLADAVRALDPASDADTHQSAAVGFADIVGFTELSRHRSDGDLTRIIARFEYRTTEIVAECGGTVVKTLGDEVLFTADTATVVADIATRMTVAFDQDADIPGLRVGAALGPVVRHLGDVFGTTVNLASRLTRLADPNTVLVAPTVADELADHPAFDLITLPPRDIRGIGSITPAVLTRR